MEKKNTYFFCNLLTYLYLCLRRRYFHSKMKRKVNIPFAFCSFIRTFDFVECTLVRK